MKFSIRFFLNITSLKRIIYFIKLFLTSLDKMIVYSFIFNIPKRIKLTGRAFYSVSEKNFSIWLFKIIPSNNIIPKKGY